MGRLREAGRKAAEFLGLRRSIVGLVGMVVLVGMGERMPERFLPLYLLALGGGDIAIGLLSGTQNLLGALYSFPGGYLSDRLGTKRALFVFNVMAMAGYVIVIVITQWWAVILGAVFFLSWSAVSLPATMELVSKALPRNKRTMGVTMHSLVRRFPMAIGPVIGGLFIKFFGVADGVRLAFAVALAMAAVSLVLQQKLIVADGHTAKKEGTRNPFAIYRLMTGDLKNLLVSDILIRFCEQIPYAFVVIWAVKTPSVVTPVSEFQFGILTAIEMATAVLVYIPVAYLADRSTKKPFVVMTFVFFTLFPLVLFFSRGFGMLVVAFLLRGMKEFGEPTRKALIMDLAPEDRKAAMFGLYYLMRDTIVSLAAFGGAFLWAIGAGTNPILGPAVNLFAAFACGIVGTVWFAMRGRDLGVTRVAA
jgi:MFS family permease